MTHNLSFRYHADMRTKGLGLGLELGLGVELELWLGSAEAEVLQIPLYFKDQSLLKCVSCRNTIAHF
jgi:hypothetical protein